MNSTELTKICRDNQLIKAFQFQEFVDGPTNKVAFEACKAIVDQFGDKKHNPLFLYGAYGLGKTHLIQAIGHAVLAKSPNAQVMYLTAGDIYIHYAQPEGLSRLSQCLRNLDLLLIDDFETFAGRSADFDDFFNMLNELVKNSKQIVIASNFYPQEINLLDKELLLHLPKMLSIEIEPPELENRVDILLCYSKLRHYKLSHDLALSIAQHILGNVRELENALNLVMETSKRQGVELSEEVINETFKGFYLSRVKHPKTNI